MKGASIAALLSVVTFTCFGQHNKVSFASSDAKVQRISLVKNSIDVPLWHERSFWPMYERYVDEDVEASLLTYRALSDLAKTSNSVGETEALENGRKLIAYRYDELEVRKKYYLEIGRALNGVIGLQFLQTEALMDMMESFRIYEESEWKKFRFNQHTISEAKVRDAKANIITAALSLSGEKADKFNQVYSKYQEECDALLGEGYNVYALYAGEPSDFTPALAKRLGYDLLTITERELKLKEKYFSEIAHVLDPVVAARFLAWEDYYSLVSKMHVWAEAP